jgi:SAM-dependent methyltransferase
VEKRALRVLRCPDCGSELASAPGELLRCRDEAHEFPVVGGIPRLLPSNGLADRRTGESFTQEWEQDSVDGPTWGMDVDERVRVFFTEPLRIPAGELRGKVVLDVGAGNGSQSVAYTEAGMEVVALDLSRGIEHGPEHLARAPDARPDHIHFVQADLRHPPLAPGSVDVIHSVGALHHTPDTRAAFRALRPLLREGGTFYVWLYGYEPGVTPVIEALRALTTRVPARPFARVATLMAPAFLAFRALTTALGVRGYPPATVPEATFALIDTFGSPHRHHHSYAEVAGWFREEGFAEVWRCNEGRRGFGVCGRLGGAGG